MFKHTPANIVQTNRLPFLIGIVLLMVVMGVFMYKAQMNQKIQFIQSKPRQSIDISPRTAEAGWFNDERFKNIKINYASQLRKPTAQEVEAQKISQDMSSTQLEIKKMQDQNRIEEKKLELEAVKSPLNIEVPPPPGTKAVSQGKKSSKDGLTDRLNELMNMVQSATGAKLPTQINIQDGKQAFLKKPGGEDNYLENSKKKPRSPYEIKAGNYISAALITGINSDLPGSVNAQVTENVFDSITGNYLLIPQGAKLIGEYNSNLSFGQQRVQVVWNRIIFPDGASLDLGRMQGIDISGYTGYYDKVDNHY
jgi:type IV secretion system protein VirB10